MKKEFTDQLIKATQSEQPTNILQLCRDHITQEMTWEDNIIDTQAEAFEGNHDLRVMGWASEDYKGGPKHITDSELDQAMFHFQFLGPVTRIKPKNEKWSYDYSLINPETRLEEIIKILKIILLSDCTGCCNAIQYINLNAHGIIAEGNLGHTYHS